MKRTLTVLALLLCLSGLAQKNADLVPGFKPMEEDSISIKGYKLTAAYYSIADNLSHKNSAATEKPTMAQVTLLMKFEQGDCYLLSKKEDVLKIILIQDYPQKQFLVMTPGDMKFTSFPNPLPGEISENRANDVVKTGVDPNARIRDGKLSFNNKEYSIVANSTIKKGIITLVRAQHWDGN
jgi:hypothetical protein